MPSSTATQRTVSSRIHPRIARAEAVASLSAVAEKLGVTPMQVALAWLLARAPNIVLIPGTSSLGHLRENLAAAELVLADEVLAELDGIGSEGE